MVVSIVYIPATHAGGVPISERGFSGIVNLLVKIGIDAEKKQR